MKWAGTASLQVGGQDFSLLLLVEMAVWSGVEPGPSSEHVRSTEYTVRTQYSQVTP
jgi:hypothetical protein